jgi:hypothetical protein
VVKKATIDKFIAAYKKYDPDYDDSRYLNEAISQTFQKYPHHTSTEQVFAKISLVNRVQRANIVRRRKGAEWTLAEFLVNKKFDNTITPLKKIRKFDAETLPEIVDVHKRFVNTAKKVLRIRAVSFCSKYLHFHFPKIIPIFDSKASETAWKLVGKEIKDCYGYRSDYEHYCLAILNIIEKLSLHGIRSININAIDHLLYDELYGD